MRPARKLRKRPVILANYSAPVVKMPSPPVVEEDPPKSYATVIRHSFPKAGEEREGGASDGYCFSITFAAGKLEKSYELVRSFLREQGYAGVPLPKSAEELRRFRLPPKLRHQLSLFGHNGYVHNPVKILFPVPAGNRGALVLEIYNEREEDHLLKFHHRL